MRGADSRGAVGGGDPLRDGVSPAGRLRPQHRRRARGASGIDPVVDEDGGSRACASARADRRTQRQPGLDGTARGDVARKNHYGSKSERGTRAAALFYTLIESAKHAGVEPAGYLAEATLRAIDSPGTVTLPGDLASV